jgi:hypothetical protein
MKHKSILLIDFLRKFPLSLLTELVQRTVPTFFVSTSLAKRGFAGCLILLIVIVLPASANTIQALRQVLQQRAVQPKMYLPDSAFIGEEIKVFVYAPGASKVQLFASNEPGQIELAGEPTRLGADYRQIGEKRVLESQDLKASFVVKLDREKDAALVDKFYMFEALLTYEDPQTGETNTMRASYFGSNANFSNNNAVKIKAEPENHATAASIAKSMIPGLAPAPGTGL